MDDKRYEEILKDIESAKTHSDKQIAVSEKGIKGLLSNWIEQRKQTRKVKTLSRDLADVQDSITDLKIDNAMAPVETKEEDKQPVFDDTLKRFNQGFEGDDAFETAYMQDHPKSVAATPTNPELEKYNELEKKLAEMIVFQDSVLDRLKGQTAHPIASRLATVGKAMATKFKNITNHILGDEKEPEEQEISKENEEVKIENITIPTMTSENVNMNSQNVDSNELPSITTDVFGDKVNNNELPPVATAVFGDKVNNNELPPVATAVFGDKTNSNNLPPKTQKYPGVGNVPFDAPEIVGTKELIADKVKELEKENKTKSIYDLAQENYGMSHDGKKLPWNKVSRYAYDAKKNEIYNQLSYNGLTDANVSEENRDNMSALFMQLQKTNPDVYNIFNGLDNDNIFERIAVGLANGSITPEVYSDLLNCPELLNSEQIGMIAISTHAFNEKMAQDPSFKEHLMDADKALNDELVDTVIADKVKMALKAYSIPANHYNFTKETKHDSLNRLNRYVDEYNNDSKKEEQLLAAILEVNAKDNKAAAAFAQYMNNNMNYAKAEEKENVPNVEVVEPEKATSIPSDAVKDETVNRWIASLTDKKTPILPSTFIKMVKDAKDDEITEKVRTAFEEETARTDEERVKFCATNSEIKSFINNGLFTNDAMKNLINNPEYSFSPARKQKLMTETYMVNFDKNINEIKTKYAKENPYAVQKEDAFNGVIKEYIDTFVKDNGMSKELYKFIMTNPELGQAMGHFKKETKQKENSEIMEPVDMTGKIMQDTSKYDREGNKLQTKKEKDYDASAQDALKNIENTKLENDDADHKTAGEANKFIKSAGNDVVRETTKHILEENYVNQNEIITRSKANYYIKEGLLTTKAIGAIVNNPDNKFTAEQRSEIATNGFISNSLGDIKDNLAKYIEEHPENAQNKIELNKVVKEYVDVFTKNYGASKEFKDFAKKNPDIYAATLENEKAEKYINGKVAEEKKNKAENNAINEEVVKIVESFGNGTDAIDMPKFVERAKKSGLDNNQVEQLYRDINDIRESNRLSDDKETNKGMSK